MARPNSCRLCSWLVAWCSDGNPDTGSRVRTTRLPPPRSWKCSATRKGNRPHGFPRTRSRISRTAWTVKGSPLKTICLTTRPPALCSFKYAVAFIHRISPSELADDEPDVVMVVLPVAGVFFVDVEDLGRVTLALAQVRIARLELQVDLLC